MKSVKASLLVSLFAWFQLLPGAWAGSPELYEMMASAGGKYLMGELGFAEHILGRGAAYYVPGAHSDADAVETILERVRLRYLKAHPEEAKIFADSAATRAKGLSITQKFALESLIKKESLNFFAEFPVKVDFANARERFLHGADFSPQKLWVRDSHFVSMKNENVLALVNNNAARSLRSGKKPLVVFDLDETGIENRSGMIGMLFGKEGWLNSAESAAFPKAREAISRLPISRVEPWPQDVFRAAGVLHDEKALESFENFLKAHPYNNEYAEKYGAPFPGFIKYVERLRKAGVQVVYVTGRVETEQHLGTLEGLRQIGLPMGEGTRFFMKPRRSITTPEYKVDVLRRLQDEGHEIIAMFDNEPENLIETQLHFDQVMPVFMDSTFGNVPPVLGDGLYKISHW